ncbi:MAG TPA: preprotein translocase subunit SecE [Patescibacteria group bacterium]|nr:preprotein translocase subunit SecE [Patescibacteria group bacterium]
MSFIDGVIAYFRSSKAELEKVSWPSKKDTMRYSALIIGITMVVSVFFLLLDSGLHAGIEAILARRTSPTTQTTPTAPVNPTPTTPTPNYPLPTSSGQPSAAAPSVSTSPVDVQAVNPNGTPATVQVTPVPLKK